MTRKTIIGVHAVGGITAFVLVASFFLASLASELSGRLDWIIAVKTYIFYAVWAMPVLMPITASTGLRLAGPSRNPVVLRKKRRLRWIALNGLILVGLAVFLHQKAGHLQFDRWFLSTQLVEFGLGAGNLFLLGNMIRDGLSLKPKKTNKMAQIRI